MISLQIQKKASSELMYISFYVKILHLTVIYLHSLKLLSRIFIEEEVLHLDNRYDDDNSLLLTPLITWRGYYHRQEKNKGVPGRAGRIPEIYRAAEFFRVLFRRRE